MKRGKILQAASHNFLETLISRNSDHQGYWVFGLAYHHLNGMTIDLLVESAESEPPANWLHGMAAKRFADQLTKHGEDASSLQSAVLEFERLGEATHTFHDCQRKGHDFLVTVKIQTEDGHSFTEPKTFFVAPNDPEVESKSTR